MLFGRNKKEKSQGVQKTNVVKEELQYIQGLKNTDVPIFFGDGKVYYIYKSCLIGTYDLPDKKNPGVYDAKGKRIGSLDWDTANISTFGSFFSPQYDYFDVFRKIEDDVKEKFQIDSNIMDFYRSKSDNEEFRLSYNVESWPRRISVKNEDYVNSNSTDSWGMMAAFICWQAFDATAEYHKYFEIF